MSEAPPIPMQWTGDSFEPVNAYWAKKCDEYFVVGERYRMVEEHERSLNSHNHFFAALQTAYDSLPTDEWGRFSSVEHFRKYLLIKCGYRHERIIVCNDDSEARKLEAYAGGLDQFAIVRRQDNVVTIWTAESMSMRAMKAKRFKQAKDDLLNEAAAMIKVTRQELESNSGRAA